MAIAALDVARSEFGLAIPADVSIVGFDDSPLAASSAYRLTTVAQDVHRMAVQATKALFDRLSRTDLPAEHQKIASHLVIRESARTPSG